MSNCGDVFILGYDGEVTTVKSPHPNTSSPHPLRNVSGTEPHISSKLRAITHWLLARPTCQTGMLTQWEELQECERVIDLSGLWLDH